MTVDNIIAQIDGKWPDGAQWTSRYWRPDSARPAASSCPYNPSTTFFECRPQTQVWTYRLSFQLLDASGAPMTAFDSLTTAAVRTVSEVSGTLGLAQVYVRGGRADRTLSGLQSDTTRLVGAATLSTAVYNAPLQSGAVPLYTDTAAESITDLLLPGRTSTLKHPAGGRVTTTEEIGPPTKRSKFATTVVFDGSSVVTLLLTATSGKITACRFEMGPPVVPLGCSS